MSKTRKLLDGSEVKEFEQALTLEVRTKCPEKWMLIDLETGQRFVGHEDPQAGPSHWKKIETCRTLT